MKRSTHLWRRVGAVLAIGCISVATAAADKVDTFSELPVSDTLRVRFVSNGCFHSSVHELVLGGGAPRTVAVFALAGQRTGAKNSVPQEDLGQVNLTDSDLKGLDSLLRFYRSGADGGCTTVDTIEIAQIRGGKTIATERFTDRSCSTYGREGVTTFSDVIRSTQVKRAPAGS